MNLGVLGGTFNPIHRAHLRLGEAARDALDLDRVLFVPASQPPLKQADLAPAQDRLEMVRHATRGYPDFEVLDVELLRDGPSFTVDTLRAVGDRFPGARLWFILGSDVLRGLDLWHQPQTLLSLASLGVAGRPGSEAPLLDLLPQSLRAGFRRTERGLARADGTEVVPIPLAPQDTSASEIRRRRARGESIRHLVPDEVAEYIEKRELYTEAS